MMKQAIALVAVLAIQRLASAHAVDEYVQATLLSFDGDRIGASFRLVPGTEVASRVLASIDTNSDRLISEPEQLEYAERFLADVSFSIGGAPLRPTLVSVGFSSAEQLREGLGSILIEATADLPRGGTEAALVFENHHQPQIAAYLVNSLLPRDRNVRIVAQHRSEDQSVYRLDFKRSAAGSMGLADE